MSKLTMGVRAWPLFILCASVMTTIATECVVGDFGKSNRNGCPNGMAVVTNRDACKNITIIGGEEVKFDNRDTSCSFMPQISFGCYIKRDGVSQFNPLQNKLDSSHKCGAKRTKQSKLNYRSVCECTLASLKDAELQKSLTDAVTTSTRIVAATTIRHGRSRGPAKPHGDVTQSSTDAMKQRATIKKKTPITSTTVTLNVVITVSESSRCPRGTVVLSNEKQCGLAQYPIGLLKETFKKEAVNYVGKIGSTIASKRPPGCFIDIVTKSQECIKNVCIQFNDNFPNHNQFPETTNFLAICVPAPPTTATRIETTKTSADDGAPNTKRASIVATSHLRTATKSSTVNLVTTTSAASSDQSDNPIALAPNDTVLLISLSAVACAIAVGIIACIAGLLFYWRHKKKRKAQSERFAVYPGMRDCLTFWKFLWF